MYILEGNIGVGKSTFLELVKQQTPEVNNLQIQILTEPVDDWSKQSYGQSLLANFYQDASRWAYTMETLTMFCRVRDYVNEQENNDPNRIIERSVYSGHYCFAQNHYQSGYLTELEWKIYSQWVDFLIHERCTPPLGFIYLKATPETCFSRVQKRNRSSESGLALDYIKRIDYWHNRFLVEKKEISPRLKDIPVLIIDCNKDFVANPAEMDKHLAKLQAFLVHTQRIETRSLDTTYSVNHSG